MYACLPESGRPVRGRGHNCRAMVVTHKHYKGIFTIAGPVEEKGRLRYIDGCTDTTLLPPLRVGDPCLNALFFPPGISQTRHYHPSTRIGLVYDGEGVCHHDEVDTPLRPGDIFVIPPRGWHCFETTTSYMRIVAFHPDSLWGPDDENHQMLDATITE
jgi:quercetin dioxygenase-like cupin family protein